MSNWNHKQKLLLDIAIVAFLSINIFTFFLILPDINTGLFSKEKEIKVTLTGITDKPDETIAYKYGDRIKYDTGIIIIKSDEINNLVAQSPIDLLIGSDLGLTVYRGVAYIDVKKQMNLTLGEGIVALPNNLKGIVNSNNRSLFIISGKVTVGQTNAQANDNISWDVDTLKVTKFDRSKLRTKVEYTSLLQVLAQQNIKEEYLQDTEPPKIYSLTPKSGSTITTSSLEISGQTDPESNIIIDSTSITVDEDGVFKLTKTLEEGNNTINLEISDKYGNINSTTIIYYKL